MFWVSKPLHIGFLWSFGRGSSQLLVELTCTFDFDRICQHDWEFAQIPQHDHYQQRRHHQHNQRQGKLMTGGVFFCWYPCGGKINQSWVPNALKKLLEKNMKQHYKQDNLNLFSLCWWRKGGGSYDDAFVFYPVPCSMQCIPTAQDDRPCLCTSLAFFVFVFYLCWWRDGGEAKVKMMLLSFIQCHAMQCIPTAQDDRPCLCLCCLCWWRDGGDSYDDAFVFYPVPRDAMHPNHVIGRCTGIVMIYMWSTRYKTSSIRIALHHKTYLTQGGNIL